MKTSKQYMVYQAHHHCTPEGIIFSTTHRLIAGPYLDEEQAEAEAKARWTRDQHCFVREIGDTTGLSPEPVDCTCREDTPDAACTVGPYLFERARDLAALLVHPGYRHLPNGLQHQLARQQARWQRKYLLHLQQAHLPSH